MRNSASGLLLRLLLAVGVGILALILFQGMWLALMSYALNANQSAGMPAFSDGTQVSGFSSFPTARPPGRVGEELTAGKLAIKVTGVVRPANARVGTVRNYKKLENDEEYLLVDISVRCISTDEDCRLTESDFGVHSASGRDIPAEFSSAFPDLDTVFEGGEMTPGQRLAGSLVFVIRKSDSGLKLIYPRLFGFGNSVEFILGL